MKRMNEWRRELTVVLSSNTGLPHASNLMRKIDTTKNDKGISALEIVIPAYLKFHDSIHDETDGYKQFVSALNEYIRVLRTPRCEVFSHQSDFISSVLPEFFFLLFQDIVKKGKYPYIIKSQKDLIIDCMFAPFSNAGIILSEKRVDVAIALPAELKFMNNGVEDFLIPLVAIEVKTNLDKNMISGIENSVESLKRTFPKCLYLAISELADFAIENQNYATTYIDEIYILRKQKRSDSRISKTIKDIDYNLINLIASKISSHLERQSGDLEPIKERLRGGALVHKR